MTTANSTPPSSAWKLRFVALLIALTTLLALSVASCTTTRKTEAIDSETLQLTHATLSIDSVSRTTLQIVHQPIPSDTAKVTLSLSNLRDLPQGAEYAAQKGRAKVKVRIRDSLVMVTASCDSLQQMVEIYAEEAQFYKARADSLSQEKEKNVHTFKKEDVSLFSLLKHFLIGLLIGALVATLFLFKITPKKNSK